MTRGGFRCFRGAFIQTGAAHAPRTLTLNARITGRVQGVWYRGWTVETARALGLAGWVRNRRDGSVEALFHGPTAQVQAMLTACTQGPDAAEVANITTTPAEPPGYDWFQKLPTE